MMIEVEPLKPYIESVDQAREAWEAVAVAYDAASADGKSAIEAKFVRAERAYHRSCAELAMEVASQVKDAESGQAEG